MPPPNDPHPPRLTDDERFRIKLLAAGLVDKLERLAATTPADTWRAYSRQRLERALESELRRTPPRKP